MNTYRILLTDGREATINTDAGTTPVSTEDYNTHEKVIQFGPNATFRASCVLGFYKIQ